MGHDTSRRKKSLLSFPHRRGFPRGLIIEPYLESHIESYGVDGVRLLERQNGGRVKAMQTSERRHTTWKLSETPCANEIEAAHPYPATQTPRAKRRNGDTFHTCYSRSAPACTFFLSCGSSWGTEMRATCLWRCEDRSRPGLRPRLLRGSGAGTFYWLALFLKLFGVTFLATRICLFSPSLGTAISDVFPVTQDMQPLPGYSLHLLAGTYFGSSWPAISHHVDSNCFALLAVACMIVWQDKRKRSSIVCRRCAGGSHHVLFSA